MQFHEITPPVFDRRKYAQKVNDNLALNNHLNGVKSIASNRTIYFSGGTVESLDLDLKHDELVFSIDVTIKEKMGLLNITLSDNILLKITAKDHP